MDVKIGGGGEIDNLYFVAIMNAASIGLFYFWPSGPIL